jgi:DNA repair protein RecN (Recombination protein N)
LLRELIIKNFALIEELKFNPSEGLNIITGETGAGKSIIFDALGLALGNRADSVKFFNKDEKCVIEAHFIVTSALKSFFNDQDLDFYPNTIVRRELTPTGRSRIFVNDSPTTLSVAKDLGNNLLDIHDQHETIGIFKPSNLLLNLDIYADQIALRNDYKEVFKESKIITEKIANLEEQKAKGEQEKDYHRFLFDELENLSLTNDDEGLEAKLNILSNAEEIKILASSISGKLSNDDFGAIESIRGLSADIGKLGALTGNKNIEERFSSLIIELSDYTQLLEDIALETELDEEQLRIIHDRFEQVQALYAKHKVNDVTDLLRIKEDLSNKLGAETELNTLIEGLKKELELSNKRLIEKQQLLREGRKKAALELEQLMINNLTELELPDARVQFSFDTIENNSTGNDRVVLLFSSSKNLALSDVNKAASGGEYSRLALVLKSLVTSGIPTLIFDEIDTGVSGRVSQKLGSMLRKLGDNHQVISITHSPQVAANAHNHFYVTKITHNKLTSTKVEQLTKPDRLEVLAQMLSGEQVTDEAKANALALLKN